MKKLFILLIGIILLSSCQVETPVSMDIQEPTVSILSVKSLTSGAEIFNSDSASYTPFSGLIDSGAYRVTFKASDNQKLLSASLIASEEGYSNEILLNKIQATQELTQSIDFTSEMFPFNADDGIKKFNISIRLKDYTELTGTSKKIGFKVFIKKMHPLEKFNSQLGMLKPIRSVEIDPNTVPFVDFASKKNRLTFIHFHTWGCLSCSEEAVDLQKFAYGDLGSPAIADTSKIYIASFGSENNPEMNEEYIQYFISSAKPRLAFDCFLDTEQKVSKFFNNLLNADNVNPVYAIFPNGEIKKYDPLETGFSEWLYEVYQQYADSGKDRK